MESIEFSGSIAYQPIKLSKELHTREDSGKAIVSLKRARGFDLIEPDKTFTRNSLLDDLKFDNSAGTKCDFLILVTMYNEGLTSVSDTLGGIMENLDSFVLAGVDLKRIACVLLVDGIKAFHSTLEQAPGFFKNFFLEEPVKTRFEVSDIRNCKLPNETEHDEFAHCFSQRLSIMDNPNLWLNFMFCVKQKNKRKLNSHLWFFGGFCEHIQPTYVMLIDVGTAPTMNSLFYLYEALATQPDLGGCTGEIRIMNPTVWSLILATQVVEYKLANIFERSVESLSGYISYMPGTFCAYRWEALQGEPLWSNYFRSLLFPEQMNAFNSNIYLASDRLLCFAVISKRYSKYTLRYVRSAVAETDAPDTFSTLLVQRRRWINGSWFSVVYTIKGCNRLFQSRHHWCRKMAFAVQMLYYSMSVLNSWVIVGSYYLFISISIKSAFGIEQSTVWSTGNVILQLYTLLLVFIAVMSFGVKPHRVNTYFKTIASLFALYLVGGVMTTIMHMNVTSYPIWVPYGFLCIVGVFFLGSFLHLSFFSILKYLPHYVFMYPSYINSLNIYAICNIHDVTWGSRPDTNTADERRRADEFEEFRTRWVIFWVMTNIGYIVLVRSVSVNSQGYYYLYGITLLTTAIVTIKFVGSILYLFHECFFKRSLSQVKDLNAILNNRKKAHNRLKKKRKGQMKVNPDYSSNQKTEPDSNPSKRLNKSKSKDLNKSKSKDLNKSRAKEMNKSKLDKSRRKEKKKNRENEREEKKGSEEIPLKANNEDLLQLSPPKTEVREPEVIEKREDGDINGILKYEPQGMNENLDDLINRKPDEFYDKIQEKVKAEELMELLRKGTMNFKDAVSDEKAQEFLLEEEKEGSFQELDLEVGYSPEQYREAVRDLDVVEQIKKDSNLPSYYNDSSLPLEINQEKDLFDPGVLKDHRFRIQMSLKRLSTLTQIDMKRLREIEGGKEGTDEEKDRIRQTINEALTN